jgi:hypothetical protein
MLPFYGIPGMIEVEQFAPWSLKTRSEASQTGAVNSESACCKDLRSLRLSPA